METANKDRIFIKIIKELSKELELKTQYFCYDWVIRFENKNCVAHVIGYDWELNTSTAQQIAKDKSACYELMKAYGVLSIEHQLFLNPQSQHYISSESSWDSIIKYAKSYNYNIVCKPNIGTGGNDVFKVDSQITLESCIHGLFTRHRAICLCPFYSIQNEYRVIILNGNIELIYKKQRPHVIGNGESTFLSIVSQTYDSSLWKNLDFQDMDLASILPNGEKIELHWQHNLGKGASAIIIDDMDLKKRLISVANNASKAININFASVDIVESNGNLLVIEINSGVMMENFARQGQKEYSLAKSIYKKAIINMLK